MEKSLPVKFNMDIFSLLSLLGNLLGKFTAEMCYKCYVFLSHISLHTV